MNELKAPDTLIGLRGTVGNGVLVFGYLLWGRLAGRIGHRQVLMISASGLALYPIATALAPSAIWLLPVAIIWGLTVAGVDVGLFDMALASCPSERQPLFGALWSMVARVGMFAGPLIGAEALSAHLAGDGALWWPAWPSLLAVAGFSPSRRRTEGRAGGPPRPPGRGSPGSGSGQDPAYR